MIEHVATVGYGRPATEALAAAIVSAKKAGPLHAVTVVVDSNLVGLSLRRLLGSGQLGGSGLVNVNFITPLHLAELLAPSPHDSGQPLTNPVLGAAVRRALRDDPGPFARVVDHPATEAAVARLYAELSHVSPETLNLLEQNGGVAEASVRLFRTVSARLSGLTGEAELVQAVVARTDLGTEAHRVGTLIWYLPAPVTASLERLMKVAVTTFPTTVVVGRTGNEAADAPVLDLCARLEIGVGAAPGQPAHASQVVSVPDSDEEVRAALRWVLARAEEGVPLDRIGIFYPSPDPYVRSLLQHLASAGIPANGPARDRLADSVAGRTLLAALELPAERWRRDRVMALVASAPVRNGDHPVRPGSWETISRAAGVVQDLDDWHRKLQGRLTQLAERRDQVNAESPATDPPAPDATNRARRQIEAIEREEHDIAQLGGFVDALAQGVQSVASATTWQAKAEAAHALLVHLLGPEPRHHSWPDSEQDAATRVVDALARLSMLDPVDPDPTPAVFVRALSSELQVGRGRHGRFGQGLVFGPLASAPGQDLDAVVVLGLAEGICPARRRDDSLLPDALRTLAPAGELPLRAQALADQHRSLLAALASAPGHRRLLVHPRGSLRSNHHHLPSRWLLDSLSAGAGHRIYSSDFDQLVEPLVDVVASHAQGLGQAPTALDPSERDRAQLLALHRHLGHDLPHHPALGPAVARGIDCLRSRHSADFTAWDGNLADQDIPSPTRDGTFMSATGLEQWAVCGFRYFLSHVLDLRDRDDPERIHQIAARDRGSVVHKILERFFAEMIDDPPAPGTPWSAAQRQRALEISVDELDAIERSGRTGRPVLWRHERQRLIQLIDNVLDTDDAERAARASTPIRVELPFGLEGAQPVVIVLADGRTVRFRGMADRVDRTTNGRWIVLDYKTGSAKKYGALEDDPFNAGTTLQLGLYAEAALQLLGSQQAAAYYWMLEADKDMLKGYPWTDDRARRFREVIQAMVDGVDTGVFPLVPGEFNWFNQSYDNCRFCDFDRLCPSDRAVYAEAKVDAPQLKIRQRLAPEAPDDEVES